MFYFIVLLVDGRIHEAQIHPDPDSEPEHLFLEKILRFLRVEVSTFVFAFLQNAIHEQT
jgi:hypothetical protein